MQTVAIVLAGGSGRRFGSDGPKQLQTLGGRTLIAQCVRAFDRAPGGEAVLVVAAADIREQVRRDLGARYQKLADVIRGGSTRTDSPRQALSWLSTRLPDDGKVLF